MDQVQVQEPAREAKCWVTAMQFGETLCEEVFPCRLGAGCVEVKWDERFPDAAELGFDGPWSHSGEETIRDMEAFTLGDGDHRIVIVPLLLPVNRPSASQFEQLKSLLRQRGCDGVPDGMLRRMLECRSPQFELSHIAAIIEQHADLVAGALEAQAERPTEWGDR